MPFNAINFFNSPIMALVHQQMQSVPECKLNGEKPSTEKLTIEQRRAILEKADAALLSSEAFRQCVTPKR